MLCPKCNHHFFEDWFENNIALTIQSLSPWIYRCTKCPNCKEIILELSLRSNKNENSWLRVFPKGVNRGPISISIPTHVKNDYIEACNVLGISAKASAALSRRCLQTILREHGYKAKDLAKEIDALLAEPNTTKAIPATLRVVLDAVRGYGNFAAHPLPDQNTAQIVDVEKSEAEICLEVIEECFAHFYVRPAEALTRKAALDAKLAAAGKPPSK